MASDSTATGTVQEGLSPQDTCAQVLTHLRYLSSHNEEDVVSTCHGSQLVLQEMHVRCPQLRQGWGGKDRCCHAVPLALRTREAQHYLFSYTGIHITPGPAWKPALAGCAKALCAAVISANGCFPAVPVSAVHYPPQHPLVNLLHILSLHSCSVCLTMGKDFHSSSTLPQSIHTVCDVNSSLLLEFTFVYSNNSTT